MRNTRRYFAAGVTDYYMYNRGTDLGERSVIEMPRTERKIAAGCLEC